MSMSSNQESLFEHARVYRPLSDRLRPNSWDHFQGLTQLAPELVKRLSQPGFIPPSLILWGPPGCGKTTFARLIGSTAGLPFVEFSAVLGGVKEVREIVSRAKDFTKPTLLFVDEIHRFNKSQQDAFLPHIERGIIILVGATTENPSFYLNSALLSRCKVIPFKPHASEDLRQILAAAKKELQVEMAVEAEDILIRAAAGDARRLLNTIERLFSLGELTNLTADKLKEILAQDHSMVYDRNGDEHYQQASAFIKSLRGSDADAALYWGFRMIESGEDPRFIIRRLVIFASEDIGNADPRALQLAVATLSAYEMVGLPEGKIPIAQCITYLATAPKSNASYVAMHEVNSEILKNPRVEVPMHLKNAPTDLMKNLGCGEGYQYPHDYDGGHVAGVDYLPKEIKGRPFYRPSSRGYEKTINERLEFLKGSSKLTK